MKQTKKPMKKPIIYGPKKKGGLHIIKAAYTASAVSAKQYPEGDTVESAFLGRSNVGKSSLINSLCNHRGLALVSGQPGKTKTINFFSVTSRETLSETEERRYDWFLVDLPGYGFAKTDKSNRNLWSSFIADYILQSERLMLLCLLIDGRHPELPIDEEAYNWLREAGVPLQIVVTKTDKLKSSEKQRNMAIIKERYACDTPPIAYSALKHTGRELLNTRINRILLGDEE